MSSSPAPSDRHAHVAATVKRVGFRRVLCPCCGGRIGFKLYCPKCRMSYA